MCVSLLALVRRLPRSQAGGRNPHHISIPAVSSQILCEIILIILNAITVAPASLPTPSAAG